MKYLLLGLLASLVFVSSASAHGGRTDKNGCHMDKKAGTRHCH